MLRIYTKHLRPQPKRVSLRDRSKTCLEGPLEAASGAAVLLNIIFVFLNLELHGRPQEPDPVVAHALIVTSNVFTLFFAVELVLKLFVWRGELFFARGRVQKYNVLDALIVSLSVLDSWILSPLATTSNLAVLRSLRIVRMLRVLRVVRTVAVFSNLRLLVSAVMSSFLALFWSMVLLFIVMLMAALFLCQASMSAVQDGMGDELIRQWVHRYYGTSSKALWTVFELTFSGGWPTYARPLVEDIHPGFSVFFVLYIAGVTFAMFRIITALFLKETLAAASLDVETTVQEKLREKETYAQRLLDFFAVADESGDGHLTWDEFQRVLTDDRVKAYFSSLELDVQQLDRLFDMLDNGDRRVNCEEFVRGAARLKGHARALDVIAISQDCSCLLKRVDDLGAMVKALHNSVCT